MKLLAILLSATSLFVSVGLHAQNLELTFIRAQEGVYGAASPRSYMIIVHPDLTITEVELEKQENGKNTGSNAIKIAEQLKKLLDQGFSVQSYSIGGGDAMIQTAIVLTRPGRN